MSLRSLSLCLSLLSFHPVFGPIALSAAASAAGKINLYDDYDCNTPSTLNPTVTLPLSTCLVTTGGGGLVIDQTPPCPQGTATLIYYQDPACGVQTTDVSTAIASNNCFQLSDGTDLYNAKSVMFSCQPAANNPEPSSTSTAVVSALAAVATGSTGGNGSGEGGGGGGGSSTSAAGSSTPTDTNTQQNSTGGTTTGSTTGSTSPSNSDSGTSSGSGLDTGDIIALAVGLGIGIPTIVIMLATWLMPDFRHKLRDWFSSSSRSVVPWAFQQHHSAPLRPQWHHYSNKLEMIPQQHQFHHPY